jgi:hypothetical protein
MDEVMSTFLSYPNTTFQIRHAIWLVNDRHFDEVGYWITRRAKNIVVTCVLFPRQIKRNSLQFKIDVTDADLAAGSLPEFGRLLSLNAFIDIYRDRMRKASRLRQIRFSANPGQIEGVYVQITSAYAEFIESVCPSFRQEDLYGSGYEDYEG